MRVESSSGSSSVGSDPPAPNDNELPGQRIERVQMDLGSRWEAVDVRHRDRRRSVERNADRLDGDEYPRAQVLRQRRRSQGFRNEGDRKLTGEIAAIRRPRRRRAHSHRHVEVRVVDDRRRSGIDRRQAIRVDPRQEERTIDHVGDAGDQLDPLAKPGVGRAIGCTPGRRGVDVQHLITGGKGVQQEVAAVVGDHRRAAGQERNDGTDHRCLDTTHEVVRIENAPAERGLAPRGRAFHGDADGFLVAERAVADVKRQREHTDLVRLRAKGEATRGAVQAGVRQ